jgi:hypothetical protein
MQPQPTPVIEIDGHVELFANVPDMMGNIMTAIIMTEQRAGRVSATPVALLDYWRLKILETNLSVPFEAFRIVTGRRAGNALIPISFDESTMYLLANMSPYYQDTLNIGRYVERLMTKAFSGPKLEEDDGKVIQGSSGDEAYDKAAANHTVQPSFGVSLVRMPSTGYARKHLTFSANGYIPGSVTAGKPSGESETDPQRAKRNHEYYKKVRRNLLFKLPSPLSDWSKSLGKIALLLDSPKYGADNMAALNIEGTIGSHSLRDRGQGRFLAYDKLRKDLAGFFFCYSWQAMVLHARINYKLVEKIKDAALKQAPSWSHHMERWWDAYKSISELPIHGVFSPISSALNSNNTIQSEHGIHELFFSTCPHSYTIGAFPPVGSTVDSDFVESENVSAPTETQITEFIQEIVLTADGHDILMSSTDPLGHAEDPESSKALRTVRTMIATQELVSPIIAWHYINSTQIKDNAIAATKNLKWVNPSLKLDELKARSADFALTDGHKYSRSVGNVVLGLTPALSKGNNKLLGFDVRYEDRFNLGKEDNRGDNDAIKYSILAVEARADNPQSAVLIEREYIPTGMNMGADVLYTKVAPISTQMPRAAIPLFHYRNKAEDGYVTEDWISESESDTTFNAETKHGIVLFTDWENTVSVFTSPEKVTDEMKKIDIVFNQLYKGQIRAFPKPNAKKRFPLSNVRRNMLWFYKSSENIPFRVVVKMTRGMDYLFWRTTWHIDSKLDFNGYVVYDDELSVSHTPAEATALADVIKDQAELPEPKQYNVTKP